VDINCLRPLFPLDVCIRNGKASNINLSIYGTYIAPLQGTHNRKGPMLFNGCAIMRHHKITSEGRAKRLSASAGRSQNNIILQSHLAISSYCYILQLCLIIMSYILKLQLHLSIMSYNYVLQLQLHNEMWMWFLSFSPLLYSIVGHFLNKGQATQPGPKS